MDLGIILGSNTYWSYLYAYYNCNLEIIWFVIVSKIPKFGIFFST